MKTLARFQKLHDEIGELRRDAMSMGSSDQVADCIIKIASIFSQLAAAVEDGLAEVETSRERM